MLWRWDSDIEHNDEFYLKFAKKEIESGIKITFLLKKSFSRINQYNKNFYLKCDKKELGVGKIVS